MAHSSFGRAGDRTRLISPPIMPVSGKCLEFYLHIYGGLVDILRVIVAENSNERNLLTVASPQFDSWKQILLEYSSTSVSRVCVPGVTNIYNNCHCQCENIILLHLACSLYKRLALWSPLN